MTVGPKLQNWICHKHVTRKGFFFAFFSLVAFLKKILCGLVMESIFIMRCSLPAQSIIMPVQVEESLGNFTEEL